jgi:hypothetical protein
MSRQAKPAPNLEEIYLKQDLPRDIGRVLGGKKFENGGARPTTREADAVAIATISNCCCPRSRQCEVGIASTEDATRSATSATRDENVVAMRPVGGRPRFVHPIGKSGFHDRW